MLSKEQVTADVEVLEEALRKKKRLLEKLENANTQFSKEPPPGTVLKFERTIAGGTRKYTFVLLSVGENSWTVTGKKNALNAIGLKESGNTWQDVTVAVGQNTLYQATGWEEAKGLFWHYFQGTESNRIYRSKEDVITSPNRNVKVERYSSVIQEWVEVQAYRPNLRYITAAMASLMAGPKAVG